MKIVTFVIAVICSLLCWGCVDATSSVVENNTAASSADSLVPKDSPKPVKVTVEQIEAAVAAAPECPAIDRTDLSLSLVDYIDCTNADDAHDFMARGDSGVVETPAGAYRTTAGFRKSFFSYRFRSAGVDKPVLIVFEYPDDDDRTINFAIHESAYWTDTNPQMPGLASTAVYTGGLLTKSGQMQYHSFIYWPGDEYPCAFVGNLGAAGKAAAAAKIWVYSIDKPLPKLEVAAGFEKQRKIAQLFPWERSIYQHFGYHSDNAVEHMLDYYQYLGVNQLVCRIAVGRLRSPAGKDGPDYVDELLAAMDARGGMSFMACLELPDPLYFGVRAPKQLRSADEIKSDWCDIFDKFIERYGKYQSLDSVAIGNELLAEWIDAGVAEDIITHIKARRVDLQLVALAGKTFMCGVHPIDMRGNNQAAMPTINMAAIDLAKVDGDSKWQQLLASSTVANYKPSLEQLKALGSFDIYQQYKLSDAFAVGSKDAPLPLSWDLNNSQPLSDAIDASFAAITPAQSRESYQLTPGIDYWYNRYWSLADYLPAGTAAMADYARAMTHHDRLAIMTGSWGNPLRGREQQMRKFAKAYLSLPPVVMEDLPVEGCDVVGARIGTYEGKHYLSIHSKIAWPVELSVDGESISLGAYELAAMTVESEAPAIVVANQDDYMATIMQRLLEAQAAMHAISQVDEAYVPAGFAAASDAAGELIMANKYYQADMCFTAGMLELLNRRKAILAPAEFVASRLYRPFEMTGDLDAWPKAATDMTFDDASMLISSPDAGAFWQGPEDLSARLRLANDRKTLYVGIEITDDQLGKYKNASDKLVITISSDGTYLNPIADQSSHSNTVWDIHFPDGSEPFTGSGDAAMSYTSRRVEGGFVVELTAPMMALPVAPGGSIGFAVRYLDFDENGNAKMAIPSGANTGSWAKLILKP